MDDYAYYLEAEWLQPGLMEGRRSMYTYDDLYFGDDGLDDDDLGYDQLPPDMSDVLSNYREMESTIKAQAARIHELEIELAVLKHIHEED